jgi:hypothetical protein
MGSFDQYPFFCAIGAITDLATNDLSLWGVGGNTKEEGAVLADTILVVTYQMTVTLGAYGYSDQKTAYDEITTNLIATIGNGTFTTKLHEISSTYNKSSIYSSSATIDAFVTTPTAEPPTGVVKTGSVSTSSSGSAESDSSLWYAVFAIIAAVAACIIFMFSFYLYRKHNNNPQGKMEALARFKRRDSDMEDAEDGEIRPEHGDLVDWDEPVGYTAADEQAKKNIVSRRDMQQQYVFM